MNQVYIYTGNIAVSTFSPLVIYLLSWTRNNEYNSG